MKQAVARSLALRVVPAADHGLRVAGVLAPGVVEDVARWISEVRRR